jgi:hypothetical protein
MRLSSPDRKIRLAAVAALVAVALTACGSDERAADRDPSASPTSASDPAGTEDPATDPNSPFVVAASAVAQRSRDQVTQLHVMGVSTTPSGELPREQVPGLAASIRKQLTGQIADCTMMPPPKGSAAAALVAALEDYKALATQLAAWDPKSGAMPASWFADLAGADESWRSALKDLGKLSDQDLLTGLAPLVMPSEGAA